MRTVVILIERVEKIHILLLDLKIKNTCIGSNTLRAGGFRNYGDTLLNSPAKSDLSRRMCIFRTKYAEDIIVQISASRQWSISLYLDPVCQSGRDALVLEEGRDADNLATAARCF